MVSQIKDLPTDIQRYILTFCGHKGLISREDLLRAVAARLIRKSRRLRFTWIAMYAASVRIANMATVLS